mgnify:CR=1 FL=1
MLKNIFYFIAFFVLFYIEPLDIGGVKIAILWKVALIGFIVIAILQSRAYSFPNFVFYNYLYSVKFLLTTTTFASIASTVAQISEVLKSMFIGLFVHFFIVKSKAKCDYLWVERLSHKLSIFIILSTLPFLFGFASPLQEGYDLSIYGTEEFGFIGFFQNAHAASVTLAFALSILTSALAKRRISKNRVFLYFLLTIGLYALYQTYVRTGFLIYFLALYFIYIKDRKLATVLVKYVPIMMIGLIGLYIAYLNSPVLQMRFSDKNVYTQNNYDPQDRWKHIGSGRLRIWHSAFVNWEEADFGAKMIGLGMEEAKDLMAEKIGNRIFAHNQFGQSLQESGVIGFVLFIIFLLAMYKFIIKRKSSQFYQTAITIYVGFIVLNILQGGHYFLIDIYLAMYLALLYMDDQKLKMETK